MTVLQGSSSSLASGQLPVINPITQRCSTGSVGPSANRKKTLEGAWNQLVQFLSILRTYLVAGSAEPSILQVVLKHGSNSIINDLSR
jgi:hypothetical protein